jgi:hypothetical protein
LSFVFKIGKDWNILIDHQEVLLVALFFSLLFAIIGLSDTLVMSVSSPSKMNLAFILFLAELYIIKSFFISENLRFLSTFNGAL